MNVVVIASGKSLTYDDVRYCCGRAAVMVVNDNWQIAPWADWLYAADYDWWASKPKFMCDDRGDIHYLPEGSRMTNAELTVRMGHRRFTMDSQAAKAFGLMAVGSFNEPGLSPSREYIHLGGNSAYQAVNLAVNFGATRVMLLGFDMGATGLGHWFGDHPKIDKVSPAGHPFTEDMNRTAPTCFDDWRANFGRLATDLKSSGVEVINCTRQTALECFPRAAIQDALPA